MINPSITGYYNAFFCECKKSCFQFQSLFLTYKSAHWCESMELCVWLCFMLLFTRLFILPPSWKQHRAASVLRLGAIKTSFSSPALRDQNFCFTVQSAVVVCKQINLEQTCFFYCVLKTNENKSTAKLACWGPGRNCGRVRDFSASFQSSHQLYYPSG